MLARRDKNEEILPDDKFCDKVTTPYEDNRFCDIVNTGNKEDKFSEFNTVNKDVMSCKYYVHLGLCLFFLLCFQ